MSDLSCYLTQFRAPCQAGSCRWSYDNINLKLLRNWNESAKRAKHVVMKCTEEQPLNLGDIRLNGSFWHCFCRTLFHIISGTSSSTITLLNFYFVARPCLQLNFRCCCYTAFTSESGRNFFFSCITGCVGSSTNIRAFKYFTPLWPFLKRSCMAMTIIS